MARQPKYDHLKQMSGRSFSSDRPIRTRSNYRNQSNHRPIRPTQGQQIVLQRAFKQELALYNNFLVPMQALLRGMPEFYTTLNERHKELFAKMARISFDIRSIFNRKSARVELPEDLEQYRDILFGVSGGTESGISEQLAIFFEVCKNQATLLPDTRECMAREFFKFYVNQTKLSENTQTLEEVNSMQKRHIQIRKEFVKTVWLPQKEHSTVRIPYLNSPIIMPSDINDVPSWNMAIIHKDPAQLDLGKTDLPWEIEFRQSEETYLLKYLETQNPISKMESRFIKR